MACAHGDGLARASRALTVDDILQWCTAQNPALSGKTAIRELGFISCARTVQIKQVPFFQACLILVLSGRKIVHQGRRRIVAAAGSILTVPALASLDLCNEPERQGAPYRALIIPFAATALTQLMQAHAWPTIAPTHTPPQVLKFDADTGLLTAIKHYLGTEKSARLRVHRLWEVLLVLIEKNPALLAYALQQARWSERVRALFVTDLARSWDIADICTRLATSQSSLRRHLKKEATGFRELLNEARLSAALMQLLQTKNPIYRIAYDCGYRSVSRFTQNFHKRFGIAPRAFRESMNESEQKLAVSGQSSAR